MKWNRFNKEVFISEEKITKMEYKDINFLKKEASYNERKRIRLCAHHNIDDLLHEMIIVHAKNTYVRPHKHLNKSESVHIIEGLATIVTFDEEGNSMDIIQMGAYNSKRKFYQRLSPSIYHTLIIQSDTLIFHETLNGPFKKSDTVFAPWAPDNDLEGMRFILSLPI